MKVLTDYIPISTRGFTDIVDITDKVASLIDRSELQSGLATVFISGSTAGVTTIEYEPGLIRDLPEAFEKVAPMSQRYHHDATWHDGNGFAHVRAALLGASLSVPFKDKRLLLGTWQQIVVVDFDNRPRRREVVVQLMGA
ncbi:MAG: secondary thiamine-phosphate synthase enzyme YjbQ [candidate division KSB1 bacterium]|nr:secondary thiamine-phosphate synthase enzyme YjbQ [candidate division KSB1 bacterium]MDZ7335305.1 secondary thiamine-phosphate synthase enzyme YjbQ [candidate division KSB1 bacterium]MDZ7357229.1 secondary thiamine-phosphate synthase enzyme YjbQ [candidate division KSB1 bacterium]MDZ7375137.1 secondary thiamine-phosphate synthase enzyme YjbQ [candidate division KSB1 bacterium]MDZ7399082.1 secondary thiamine-phosphate synthase enzyme YjbQ [candidate division KSB1 bacterium]